MAEDDESFSWETDYQRRSRENFIKTWKGYYPDDRLASLAMCWLNMKFFGCKYPAGVESVVRELESKCPPVTEPEVHVKKPKPPKRSAPETIVISNFTVYEPAEDESIINAISVLSESAQKCKKSLSFQESWRSKTMFTCAVVLQDKVISVGEGASKKDAKRDAAEKALEILRSSHDVVKKRKIDHEAAQAVNKTELTRKAYEEAAVIPESNLGNQLLRKMGWTGSGGIGKEGQGRAEPVMVTGVDGKRGLGTGNDDSALHRDTVQKLILDFINSNNHDLKFSNELSKEDRALVHQLSQKYGLRHQSYGKGEQRYLMVSKNYT